jgi:hypothetical protein
MDPVVGVYYCFVFWGGSIGVRTQGLILAQQALYHLSQALSCQTVFQSGCPTLYNLQQCMTIQILLRIHQHL